MPLDTIWFPSTHAYAWTTWCIILSRSSQGRKYYCSTLTRLKDEHLTRCNTDLYSTVFKHEYFTSVLAFLFFLLPVSCFTYRTSTLRPVDKDRYSATTKCNYFLQARRLDICISFSFLFTSRVLFYLQDKYVTSRR